MLAYVRESEDAERHHVAIDVVIEPAPLGTGGALVHAAHALDEAFVLTNGDSWFDFNWLDLVLRTRATGLSAGVALRRIAVADRYEILELDGHRVARIRGRSAAARNALINGGVIV